MAEKFAVGDTVRLTKKFDNLGLKLKPATQGKIIRINKKFLGKTEYVVDFKGIVLTMNGSGSFVLAQVDDSSGVSKG